MNQQPITVVHFHSSFGALTQNWIYEQFAGLRGITTKFYSISLVDGNSSPVSRNSFNINNLRCLWEDLGYFSLLFNRAVNKFFHRFPQLLLWLWKDRVNVVHAHFGSNGHLILPYIKLLDIPLVTSFYGFDAYLLPHKPEWAERYKKLFSQGRLFLAEGSAMREKLISLGCPAEKIVIHHIGINIHSYEFRVRKPDGPIRLLACGRFVEKKGIPYAIEALARIRSKTNTDVRLTIVGDSDNQGTLTPEKIKIQNAISQHGLGKAVTLTGYLSHDELLKIRYTHHIFLVPSVHASNGDAEGGFPVILTEVLATGMPVVGFSHCDIPEVVQHGKSGFLVPERDVDALAERLTYLIEHPEIWPKMGRAGRAFVEEHYNIDKLNDRLVEIYKDLNNGRRENK